MRRQLRHLNTFNQGDLRLRILHVLATAFVLEIILVQVHIDCGKRSYFCLLEVRATVVAVEEPSAERTAIFTVCIV